MSKTVAQLDAEVQALKLEVAGLTKLVGQLVAKETRLPFVMPSPIPYVLLGAATDQHPDRTVDPLAPTWLVDHTPAQVIPPGGLSPLNKG